MILTFDNDVLLDNNTWLYIENISNNLNQNYKIIEQINNKTYVIETNVDQSSNISNIIDNIINIKIRKEKSVLPFKTPDLIRINLNTNSVEPDTNSAKIIPDNNNLLINNLLINESDNGEIPHVYNGDFIERKLIKKTSKEYSIY